MHLQRLARSWETNPESTTCLAWFWLTCESLPPPWLKQANERDLLLENQLNTQENKNSTAAGQAQGLRVPSRTLPCPCQPLLTKTKTETETKT